MTNENEFSNSNEPIKPLKSTNGPSFGLLPTTGPELMKEKRFSLLFAEGLIADPKTANEKLFTAEFLGDTGPNGRVGLIKPNFEGWYRVDFYCGFRIEGLDLSSTPSATITTILRGGSIILANTQTSFEPKIPKLHYFHISRVVHLAAKTSVSVGFDVRQTMSQVRLWQGASDSDTARSLTGFYLTLLER